MSATQYDDNEVPFEVEEETEIGDLSAQEGGVLPIAYRVLGTIKRAKVTRNLENNKYSERDDNQWTFKSLRLDITIGENGIDKEGAYAGTTVSTDLMDLIIAINPEALKRKARSDGKDYNDYYWERKARYGIREFLTAQGYDMTKAPAHPDNRNPPPKINDDFLISLVGVPVMFDIKREKDTFRGEGEFKNRFANWRAVETSEE